MGEKAITYTVTDEGNGFDVEHMHKLFKKSGVKGIGDGGEPGLGISFFISSYPYHCPDGCNPENSDLVFAYNEKGNQWMFFYKFDTNRYIPLDSS